MTIHKYGVEKFQTPNTDADIEKKLLGEFKFTKGKPEGTYEMWPDDEIHSVNITHTPYDMAMENFKHSVNRVVTTFESKGYELTNEQKELAVKGLLSGYRNKLDPQDRETYSALINEAVYRAYEDDGILDHENKETGFTKKFGTTRSVIDYLKAVDDYNGHHGKVQKMTKARSVVQDLHNATAIAYKSLYAELKQINYRDSLVKLSATDEKEELRKALIEYLKD